MKSYSTEKCIACDRETMPIIKTAKNICAITAIQRYTDSASLTDTNKAYLFLLGYLKPSKDGSILTSRNEAGN